MNTEEKVTPTPHPPILEKYWVPAIIASIDRMTPGGYRKSNSVLRQFIIFVAQLWVGLIVLLLLIVAAIHIAQPDAPAPAPGTKTIVMPL